MRFSLHIFFALAALGFVTAAAVLGASQGLKTVNPGQPESFQQAANAIAR